MDRTKIDETLVRSLLHDQHPDLAGLALKQFDGGWDNQMWRLGEDLAIRLPMTPRGPALLENERRWMPDLALRLPLPVPVPIRFGEPTEYFPNPWTVTTWVPGEPADAVPAENGPESAEALAAFLTALHQQAPANAPVNPNRGISLRQFPEGSGRHLKSEQYSGDLAPLQDIWDAALEAEEWTGPPVWLHGDLHPANALVTDGTLSGVIDFGELCAGDPACDLAAVWILLPEGAVAGCIEAYPLADEAMIRRARGWAIHRAFGLLQVGHAGEMGWAGGKITWKQAGELTLQRVLATL